MKKISIKYSVFFKDGTQSVIVCDGIKFFKHKDAILFKNISTIDGRLFCQSKFIFNIDCFELVEKPPVKTVSVKGIDTSAVGLAIAKEIERVKALI